MPTTTPDRDEKVAALIERVHGMEATCRRCGVRGHVGRETIETLRSILTGSDHRWGLCGECVALPIGRSAHPIVAAALLGLAVDDPALVKVTVEDFADGPDALPEFPNASPWGHVSRKRLVREVAKERARIDAETAHHCSICGRGRSSKWWTRGSDWACDDCHRDHFLDGMWQADTEILDLVATRMAGLSGGLRSRRIGLAAQLGVRMAGGTVNDRPWAHVDRSGWSAILDAKPQFNSLEGMENYDWWVRQQEREDEPLPPPKAKRPLLRRVGFDEWGTPIWEPVVAK